MTRKSLEAVPRVPGVELTLELKEWFNSVFRHYRIIETRTQTLTPGVVNANTTSEQLFTLTGVEVEDTVLAVTKPTHTASVGIVGARVSATNQLSVIFMNSSAGGVTPPSETYKIDVLKFRGN